MKNEKFLIHNIPARLWGEPSDKLVLFIHGQGGNKEEAETFSKLADARGWQVLSIDLPEHGERQGESEQLVPWVTVPELQTVLAWSRSHWKVIDLAAVSIGAWFSLQSFAEEEFERCFLVSPVVDMNQLIHTMMQWAGVDEARLRQEKIIRTDFGQTLSWDYLLYARSHPVAAWSSPTWILAADHDHLTDLKTFQDFADRFHCHLTVMKDGEHWFHTPTQLAVLKAWTEDCFPG